MNEIIEYLNIDIIYLLKIEIIEITGTFQWIFISASTIIIYGGPLILI